MEIGPYKDLVVIGRGGSGTVYRGRAPDGTVVALKTLTERDPARLARFAREIRLQSSLSLEDGFVPLLGHGVANGVPYLVMPLLDGGTLRDRLARQGRLPSSEAAALGVTVARALGRAHERGILHRDLKPENILFAPGGAPLLSDLGLAKHFLADVAGAERSVDLTRSRQSMGTYLYMPPEQMADAARVTPAADVFALGAVLYECLTGSPPFDGATVLEIVAKVERHELVKPSDHVPEISRGLEDVILRALAHEPAERFADGDALATALESFAPGRRRLPRYVGLLVAVAGTALVLAAVLGVVGARAWRRAKATRLASEALALVAPESLAGVDSRAVRARADDAFARAEQSLALDDRGLDALAARAIARRRRGEVAQAIADGTLLLERDPTRAAAWRERGIARQLAQEPEGALADLTRSLELDPHDVSALVERARVRLSLADKDRALADATLATELGPGVAAAFLARAEVILSTSDGEDPAAIRDCSAAIDRDPRLALAYADRGLARWTAEKDLASARRDGARAIELAPEDPLVWCRRSLMRRISGDSAGALEDASRAIEADPRSGEAWLARGCARLYGGHTDEALADMTRAIELDPHLAGAWASRAVVHYTKHDAGAALADATRTLALDPREGQTWGLRGSVRGFLEHDIEGGIADLTKALELSPRRADFWSNRGDLNYMKGDPTSAINDLSRALELEPLASRWNMRAKARILTRDEEGAINDENHALALQPNFAAALETRGLALLGKGDARRALADENRSIELDPSSALAWLVRGMAKKSLQDEAGATADLRHCLELKPDPSVANSAQLELRKLKVMSTPGQPKAPGRP